MKSFYVYAHYTLDTDELFYKISKGGFHKSMKNNKQIKGWSFKYV